MNEKKITGHLKEVNGVYHIVLNYYDENGKRKNPSISTKLPLRGNKKQAKAMLKYLINVFVIPKDGGKANLKSYFTKDMLKKMLQKRRRKRRNKQNPNQLKRYVFLRICYFLTL